MILALVVFVFVVERRDLNKKQEKKSFLENLGEVDD